MVVWSVQELIQQMANIHFTENVTEDQLDAMAGSETLRYQATLFGIVRNNKVHKCVPMFFPFYSIWSFMAQIDDNWIILFHNLNEYL